MLDLDGRCTFSLIFLALAVQEHLEEARGAGNPYHGATLAGGKST